MWSKRKKGKIFVVSAPSGTGKTTLCRLVQKEVADLCLSVSLTTRPPRQGEKDKVDYFFISPKTFEEYIKKNQLAEWAKVFGHYYGTLKKNLEETINKGRDIILEIDVQGGLQIKEKYPESILIFILPPSMKALKERLKKRQSEEEKSLTTRLKIAREEMKYLPQYDYLVINNVLKEAVDLLKGIVLAERAKIKRGKK
jgi:guanylate kinase